MQVFFETGNFSHTRFLYHEVYRLKNILKKQGLSREKVAVHTF